MCFCVQIVLCSTHFSSPSLSHVSLLPLQIPSASQLMETVHVKMKERKVLTEELAMLTTPVSEKA